LYSYFNLIIITNAATTQFHSFTLSHFHTSHYHLSVTRLHSFTHASFTNVGYAIAEQKTAANATEIRKLHKRLQEGHKQGILYKMKAQGTRGTSALGFNRQEEKVFQIKIKKSRSFYVLQIRTHL
jgi:hypothetical protein